MSLFLKNLSKTFFRSIVSSRPVFSKSTSLFSSISNVPWQKEVISERSRLRSRQIYDTPTHQRDKKIRTDEKRRKSVNVAAKVIQSKGCLSVSSFPSSKATKGHLKIYNKNEKRKNLETGLIKTTGISIFKHIKFDDTRLGFHSYNELQKPVGMVVRTPKSGKKATITYFNQHIRKYSSNKSVNKGKSTIEIGGISANIQKSIIKNYSDSKSTNQKKTTAKDKDCKPCMGKKDGKSEKDVPSTKLILTTVDKNVPVKNLENECGKNVGENVAQPESLLSKIDNIQKQLDEFKREIRRASDPCFESPNLTGALPSRITPEKDIISGSKHLIKNVRDAIFTKQSGSKAGCKEKKTEPKKSSDCKVVLDPPLCEKPKSDKIKKCKSEVKMKEANPKKVSENATDAETCAENKKEKWICTNTDSKKSGKRDEECNTSANEKKDSKFECKFDLDPPHCKKTKSTKKKDSEKTIKEKKSKKVAKKAINSKKCFEAKPQKPTTRKTDVKKMKKGEPVCGTLVEKKKLSEDKKLKNKSATSICSGNKQNDNKISCEKLRKQIEENKKKIKQKDKSACKDEELKHKKSNKSEQTKEVNKQDVCATSKKDEKKHCLEENKDSGKSSGEDPCPQFTEEGIEEVQDPCTPDQSPLMQCIASCTKMKKDGEALKSKIGGKAAMEESNAKKLAENQNNKKPKTSCTPDIPTKENDCKPKKTRSSTEKSICEDKKTPSKEQTCCPKFKFTCSPDTTKDQKNKSTKNKPKSDKKEEKDDC